MKVNTDFHQITRSQTVISPPASQGEIEAIRFALIDRVFPIAKGIGLLGVTLSSLVENSDFGAGQLRLALWRPHPHNLDNPDNPDYMILRSYGGQHGRNGSQVWWGSAVQRE
ncbi:hypothetical protein [Bosea sp. AK1]|uniref:DinB/UmuC family translesion DNA polymerase n=1 Tax=Bosea sp. AK1 TaxID=2587160 RepID=UPI0032C006C8